MKVKFVFYCSNHQNVTQNANLFAESVIHTVHKNKYMNQPKLKLKLTVCLFIYLCSLNSLQIKHLFETSLDAHKYIFDNQLIVAWFANSDIAIVHRWIVLALFGLGCKQKNIKLVFGLASASSCILMLFGTQRSIKFWLVVVQLRKVYK